VQASAQCEENRAARKPHEPLGQHEGEHWQAEAVDKEARKHKGYEGKHRVAQGGREEREKEQKRKRKYYKR